MTKQLRIRLNKQLSKITESEIDLNKLKNDIKKYANGKTVSSLVWALIEPTAKAGGDKFIKPDFNSIKPHLINDIKAEIKIMQKEGWDEPTEEIAKQLLDPSQYDDELGNYVDTCLYGYYADMYDGHSDLNILMNHEDDVMQYLGDGIRRNYKQLIREVK